MAAYTAEKGALAPYGWETVTLKGGGQEVRILGGRGFNLYHWTYQGGELLMEPVDFEAPGAKYGIPLRFPTPNRMQDATYTWLGVARKQQKRGRIIDRHGLVLDEPWQTRCWAEEEAAVAEGKLTVDPESPLHNAYPVPLTLTVRYTLSGKGLRLDVSVENEGKEDAPFGFAIHTYL